MSGKESYQFGDKLLSREKLIKGLLLLNEIVQLFSWIIFLLFLITYFYPINKSLTQIYQEQVAKADFANKSIRSGLASFIKINNNFFADLKLSLLNYAPSCPIFITRIH